MTHKQYTIVVERAEGNYSACASEALTLMREAADTEDATDKSAVTPDRSSPRANCPARCRCS